MSKIESSAGKALYEQHKYFVDHPQEWETFLNDVKKAMRAG